VNLLMEENEKLMVLIRMRHVVERQNERTQVGLLDLVEQRPVLERRVRVGDPLKD
jgi:hypothetical protein